MQVDHGSRSLCEPGTLHGPCRGGPSFPVRPGWGLAAISVAWIQPGDVSGHTPGVQGVRAICPPKCLDAMKPVVAPLSGSRRDFDRVKAALAMFAGTEQRDYRLELQASSPFLPALARQLHR